MICYRLRIVAADAASYLGIVEGVPQILVQATTIARAEAELCNALADHLPRDLDFESTLLELDDLPTVTTFRIYLSGLAS